MDCWKCGKRNESPIGKIFHKYLVRIGEIFVITEGEVCKYKKADLLDELDSITSKLKSELECFRWPKVVRTIPKRRAVKNFEGIKDGKVVEQNHNIMITECCNRITTFPGRWWDKNAEHQSSGAIRERDVFK